MAFQNSTQRLKTLSKAKEGIGKHFQNVSSLTLGGRTIAPAALQALIQAELDAMSASGKLRADLKVQIGVEHDAHDGVEPLLRSLKAFVVAMYGDSAAATSALEDFGYKPRKSSKKTLDEKVGAQAKAKATRAARHTVGPKKKQAIKGQPATPAASKPVA